MSFSASITKGLLFYCDVWEGKLRDSIHFCKTNTITLVKDSTCLRARFLKARMSRVVEERFIRCVSQLLTAIFISISYSNDFNLRKMHGHCRTASY